MPWRVPGKGAICYSSPTCKGRATRGSLSRDHTVVTKINFVAGNRNLNLRHPGHLLIGLALITGLFGETSDSFGDLGYQSVVTSVASKH
jgi:hypothetical protein